MYFLWKTLQPHNWLNKITFQILLHDGFNLCRRWSQVYPSFHVVWLSERKWERWQILDPPAHSEDPKGFPISWRFLLMVRTHFCRNQNISSISSYFELPVPFLAYGGAATRTTDGNGMKTSEQETIYVSIDHIISQMEITQINLQFRKKHVFH